MGTRKWSKVLYQNNGFADNYTDNKFLEDLKRNVHFRPVDGLKAITASTRISTQINVTVVFLTVFYHLYHQEDFWLYIYLFFSTALMISYILVFGASNLLPMLKNVVLLLVFGYACTPVLKTLTDTISTDTIFAMTTVLIIIHIVFHKYGLDGTFVSPYLSLNASMCAAISLASRLEETKHAFILLTLAVETFALFPELYEVVDYSLVVFFTSTVTALVCTFYISGITLFFYGMAILCINFAFPLLFVWTQKYKDNLYGPWDEAGIFNK